MSLVSRRKFTGKVRRGLYLLTSTNVADVLNVVATKEEVGLSARQVGDANSAVEWILGELAVRGEHPYRPVK